MNAFIFARGGSKGVPNKNIRSFAGKPLIAWTIEFARNLEFVESVIVSTDSVEIAEIAIKYGAQVPFMRPPELAGDDTPEWLAWRHALTTLYDSEDLLQKEFLSLPSTAPLRNQQDVEAALLNFRKGDVDVVVTMSEARRHPSFNIVRSSNEGYIELFEKSHINKHNRQAFEEVFDIATVCYVAKPSFIMNHDSIFEGRVRGSRVPQERCIDIDSILDFDVAEYMFMKQKGLL